MNPGGRRSRLAGIVAAIAITAGLTGQETRPLTPGSAVEREMSGGQKHNYLVALEAGQFARVIVDQRGIDVVVTIFAPDGSQLTEVDGDTGAQGPEDAWWVASVAGNYRVQVAALEAGAPAGRYEAKIGELRPARQADRDRMAAEQAFQEVERLKAERKPESLRQAIAKYPEVRRLWQKVGDRKEEATTVNNLAFTYEMLNEVPQALASYQEALPIWREVRFPLGEGLTLENIGRIHKNRGETKQALEYYLQALDVFRAAHIALREGIARNNAGLIYSESGENEKAIEHYEEAIRLFRSVHNREEEATTLTSIGRHYDWIGEKRKAREYLNQALALARSLHDAQREALTQNLLGLLFDSMGESDQALDAYRSALRLFQQVRDRRGQATSTNNMGLLYAGLGERDRALENYQQALTLFRTIGDKRREAYSLSNIGMIYAEAGDHPKALENFAAALPLSQAVGDRRMAATVLDNAGAAMLAMGDREKALDNFQRALALSRETEDARGEANTLNHLGRAYAEQANFDKAGEFLDKALAIRREIHDRRGEGATLFERARVERDRGNLASARALATDARGIVESLRSKVDSQELRTAYLASVQQYYGLETELLMRMHAADGSAGFQTAAFEVSERARARSLLDSLAESGADIRQGVDASLLEKEQAAQTQLNRKELERMRVLSGKHTAQEAEEVERAVRSLARQYEDVQTQIRSRSPHYASLVFPQPLRTADIQREILDRDTVLLEYGLGDERSFLWVVSPSSVQGIELPKRSEVEEAARGFYEGITKPRTSESRASAEALSRMLLGKAEALLVNKRLLIVADGALQYLPFAALPDPADPARPLVAGHEVINAPSASTVAILRREGAGRPPAPKLLAILADPVFSADDARLRRVAPRQEGAAARPEFLSRSLGDVGITPQRIPRLPGTRREAAAIVSLVPPAARKEALDFDASRAMLSGPEIGQYRIVHLATHGLLNSVHPELSGIVLSMVDRQGAPLDGFLRLNEIYNLKLAADLVVLSACQTGLGKEIRGEGLVGLTRGFMYAGAPRVMASLWKVDDQATAELMKQFYAGMFGTEHLHPAAALRAAQIHMAKTKGFEDPYYWGAFTLQGDWK